MQNFSQITNAKRAFVMSPLLNNSVVKVRVSDEKYIKTHKKKSASMDRINFVINSIFYGDEEMQGGENRQV